MAKKTTAADSPETRPAARSETRPEVRAATARKERVALWSVFASGVLAVVKLAAGLFSGSLALLSEAAHSLADTAATTVTWLAVRWSGKPADEEHQYGHGKIESVAALVETGALFALALVVLAFAVQRLVAGGAPVEASAAVFAVVGLSIAIDVNRIRILQKTARETGSMALAADALHFAADMAGSIAVLLGLIAARLGFAQGDAAAALLVALFIGSAGWRLGRRALDTLMDAAPEGRAARLRRIAETVPGVAGVDAVRARSDGSRVFAEMRVAVSRAHPLDEVSRVTERVRTEVAREFPDTELTLATRAVALSTETVRERVLLAGARFQLPLHHVTVQEVAGRLCISFDMEVPGGVSLAKAHDDAEAFKRALRGEFGAATEVEPHVEPMEVNPLSGRDAAPEILERVGATLRSEAEKAAAAAEAEGKGEVIRDIHDVRVRETRAGWVVNYHCRADGGLPVEIVHQCMDDIEHKARAAHPDIVRIVGHADALTGRLV